MQNLGARELLRRETRFFVQVPQNDTVAGPQK
jgi:hypothetical protein